MLEIECINHEELALSRLVTQFRESVNLINYIKKLLIENDSLELVYKDIIEQRWLANATGVNLDIIGTLVGQSREFIEAEIFEYFGFADNGQAQSFGSVNDNNVGGRFIFVDEVITGVRRLTDDEYRTFIRARIVKNSTRSTPEDIISQLAFIFDSPRILFRDGNTFYEVSLGRVLTLNEKSLLLNTTIIPKTAGVAAGYLTEFDSDDFFSFTEVEGGNGFGSVTNFELGSKFGRLIF